MAECHNGGGRMAGDWIPMRLDLREDPAVVFMATELKVREEVIVGYLHAVWSWFSRQSGDGLATIRRHDLARVLNLPDFPSLMVRAGWLIETIKEDGTALLEVPNWDRWLSNSAKNRLKKTAQRQSQRCRQNVANVGDKKATTVQERRVKKKRRSSGTSNLTQNGKSSGGAKKFRPPTIEQVMAYCKKRQNSVNPQAWMDHYLSNGWKIGANKMTDWEAAVRTWEANSFKGSKKTPNDRTGPGQKYDPSVPTKEPGYDQF